MRRGRSAEARRELVAAREQYLRVADEASPNVLAIDAALADIERAEGDPGSALRELAAIVARQRARDDRDVPTTLLALARASVATGDLAHAQAALGEALETLARQDRRASALGREVELVAAGLPWPRGIAAEHWRNVARIGCINFGCEDARVQEWLHRAAREGAGTTQPKDVRAGARPFEAQYAVAIDILARAAEPTPPGG